MKSKVAVIFPFALSAACGADFSFSGLGELPGAQNHTGMASAVSSNGGVIVGVSDSSQGPQAFRWTAASGMVGLGDLSGDPFGSRATAVSGNGMLVCGTGCSSGASVGFRWTSGGMSSVGVLAGGGTFSDVYGVSADGTTTVGTALGSSMMEAFRWTSSKGMVSLGTLPAATDGSRAIACSLNGEVIVGFSDSALGYQAFRWTQSDGMVPLGFVVGGTGPSYAMGVSSDGSVVVGGSDTATGFEAFRWIGGAMVPLGDLPGGEEFSIAHGVSGDGLLVVGESSSSDGDEAMIWSSSAGMLSLKKLLLNNNLPVQNWHLMRATAISADGRTVVGFGINPSGYQEAFKATVEPGLSRTVSGQILFSGLSQGAPAPSSVTLEFRTPGTNTVVKSLTANLGGNGQFSVHAPMVSGPYDLTIKHSHWLRRTISIDTSSQNVAGAILSLINGDIDGDNMITIFDYSLLATYFDMASSSGAWSTLGMDGIAPKSCDLDEDGVISIEDYSILVTNFEACGDD